MPTSRRDTQKKRHSPTKRLAITRRREYRKIGYNDAAQRVCARQVGERRWRGGHKILFIALARTAERAVARYAHKKPCRWPMIRAMTRLYINFIARDKCRAHRAGI